MSQPKGAGLEKQLILLIITIIVALAVYQHERQKKGIAAPAGPAPVIANQPLSVDTSTTTCNTRHCLIETPPTARGH